MMGLAHLSHKREFNEEMRGYEEGKARFEGRISFVKLDVMHLQRYIEADEYILNNSLLKAASRSLNST
jgi:hypothetical protein